MYPALVWRIGLRASMSFVRACPGYAFGLDDRFTLQVLRQAIGTVLSSFLFFKQTSMNLSPLRLVGNSHGCSQRAVVLTAGQLGPTDAGQLISHGDDQHIASGAYF
jgi:hypothetical protein